MAQSLPPENAQQGGVIFEDRVLVLNKYGEMLVGVLSKAGSRKLVILCHGFCSSKGDRVMVNLSTALSMHGVSNFRFDFSGNGESQGQFQFGNYRKEAEDLHAIVQHFSEKGYEVITIVGHSKGGDVVLLYGSMYDDVGAIINISGRFDLQHGLEERLGKEFIERIKRDGYLDLKKEQGKVIRVTEESLMERLNTDMKAAALSISNKCRVLTVHGSADEIIPVQDAFEFSKIIPNHKHHIIDGANHCYTEHESELASIVVEFVKSIQDEGAGATGEN
ncbi:Feruloyl esterase protein [Dioscorea alata]|uniref:Feruloyl esterase protein n=1 Tax=Dioscorea alata TaxID=55571 RepID=A0ACB7TQ81_DIOAL|nr:Feruloyl esterase protein [Dioscorea alata]